MLSTSLLFLLTACAQATVVPRTIVAPYQNPTYANPTLPTTLAGPSCPVNCSYTLESATVYSWIKVIPSATITHAVEYVIVNNRTNTTRTSTSFLELPANVTIPPTNSAGTRVWEKTISSPVGTGRPWSTFVTNITYPQSFTQYASAYTWWGALGTTTTGGASVCAWEPYYWTGSNFHYSTSTWSLTYTQTGCDWYGPSTTNCPPIYPHTELTTITSASWRKLASGTTVTMTSVNEFGSASPTVDPEDPKGYLWIIGRNGPIVGAGATANPSPPGNTDAIWSSCEFHLPPLPYITTSAGVEPVGDLSSALFVTVTSTLHEDSGPTTTSAALGEGFGSLLESATASSGASATVDQPSAISTAKASGVDIISEHLASSANGITWTVDGEQAPTSRGETAQTTADLSFSFPSPANSPSTTQASDTASFDLGPSKPTSSEDQSVGVDMGFTKSSSAQAQTSGIDTAQVGTPVATPAGDVSVSGEGFNTGIKPTLTGPTLILTEISGQFVLATAGTTSAPATSTTGLGGMILSGLGETGSSSPDQTTAASEPESPEQTTDAGLPVVTTGAPQEPESTAAAAAPTPVEVGGITVSQNSDTQLVVGSQTLEAGSSIIVGSGSSTTAVVLETDGSSTRIVVGTATAAVPSPAPAEPEATGSAEAAPSPFEVGGVTASQNSASEIVVGTQTLAPGSSIVLGSGSSTTAVALQTADGTTQLVVGSSTAAVPAAAPASTGDSAASAPAPFEVDGVTISQNTASQLIIGSQTLALGSSIIIGSGTSTTAIALETSSGTTRIVVGSSTAAIPTAATSPAAAAAAPIVFGSQTLHPGSTLTLGSGSQTTALVLSTNAAGSSAIVVADASTTYTVAAPSASPNTKAGGAATTNFPTTGAHLLTTGGTTELAIGSTTYTFKTGGPSIALSTRSGTTIVVAGTGSAQSLIPIPTGMADGDSSSSSSSATTTTATGTGDGLPSSGLGGGVGWATSGSSATASGSGAAASGSGAAASSTGAAAGRAEAGWVGVVWAVVVAVVVV